MALNQSRVLASELFLFTQWHNRTGSPTQRRTEIFQDFVKLGMRERWPWHAKAEPCELSQFTAEEKQILECRDWPTRCIAGWIGQDLRRVVVTSRAETIRDSDVEFRTDLEGDQMLVCRYSGSPFDVLPELAYSMTAFDDPEDVAEARQTRTDRSLWVSGVFWIEDKIMWVDEYGVTIREKTCDLAERQQMQDAAEAFEEFRPFESSWWTEAVRVGKYAEEHWWL